jgi:hypothetical protein
MSKWEKIKIVMPGQGSVDADAPPIISASRATDIPAYFGDWFMERLHAGVVEWKNRFNNLNSLVSFAKTRLIVFWTKNPSSFMDHLDELDRLGFNYYFQFTLNDYEKEGFEPGLPPLDERIGSFIRLSKRIGKEKVIWRFDPVIFTDSLDAREIGLRIQRLAERLAGHTEKLVISFCDISNYPSVAAALKNRRIQAHETSAAEAAELSRILAGISKKTGLALSACAEPFDLKSFGITPNQCIDGVLIRKLFFSDRPLMEFMDNDGDRKDPGQRKLCGCILSKDIGAYATCKTGCVYCYSAV